MAWLLDTNILSELRKPRPNQNVLAFVSGRPLEELYVSAVTLAELRFGIELVSDVAGRRSDLTVWLSHTVRPMFEGRVLPINEETMLIWRRLLEAGRKQGHTFSQPDLIIAATAPEHNLTVATRDIGDFNRARVPLVNPWQPA
jgi:toxin FitB